VSPVLHLRSAKQPVRQELLKVPHIFGGSCRRLIHLRTRRFFLTGACRTCQLQKTGRGCHRSNRGAVASPRRPFEGPPREPLRARRASRPGGCLPAPALGDFRPCPHFGIRHSPPVPHGKIIVGRLIRSTEAAGSNARHCCSTPDGDRTGPPGARPPNDGFLPGAGRCRARCWIQTPRRWQRQGQDRLAPAPRG
jgi:hypothetical protein